MKGALSQTYAATVLFYLVAERLVSISPLIHAGIDVKGPVAKAGSVACIQALAGILSLIVSKFVRFKFKYVLPLLMVISGISSFIIAFCVEYFDIALGLILIRESISNILTAFLLGNFQVRAKKDAVSATRLIQIFTTISILFAFSLTPILVAYAGLAKICLADGCLRFALATALWWSDKKIGQLLDSPSFRVEAFFSTKLPRRVVFTIIAITTIAVSSGVMNILEIPTLVSKVRATASQISLVLLVFAGSYLVATSLLTKATISAGWSQSLLITSAFLLSGSTLFFLDSSSVVFCGIAIAIFGIGNSIFTYSYNLQFQELRNASSTSYAILLASIGVKIGVFLSAVMILIVNDEAQPSRVVLSSLLLALVIIVSNTESVKKFVSVLFGQILLLAFCLSFSAQPVSATTLRVLSDGIPDKMDPVSTRLISWGTVFNQVFDALYEYSESNNLRPLLADKHTISADGRRIRIYLKTGIHFSDGSPLDAQIVLQSLRRTIDRMGHQVKWALGDIEGFDKYLVTKSANYLGIKAVSPTELEFSLSKPFPYLLQVLTAPNFLIVKEGPNGTLVGTGAYKPASISSSQVVLVHREEIPKKTDAPDKLHFELVELSRGVGDYLRSNAVDLAVVTPMFKEAPRGYVIKDYRFIRAMFVLLNTKSVKFKESKSRCQFVSRFERAVKVSGYGWENVFNGFPFAWDLFPTAKDSVFNGDPKEISGPVTVYFSDSMSAHFDDMSNAKIVASLGKQGISTIFKKLSLKQISQRFMSGDFEAIMMGYVPDYLDPDAIVFPLLGTNQQYNLSRYSNPIADAFLSLAREMTDQNSRNLTYKALFKIIGRECPVQFLGSESGRYVVSDRWTMPPMSGLGFYNIKFNKARFIGRESK